MKKDRPQSDGEKKLSVAEQFLNANTEDLARMVGYFYGAYVSIPKNYRERIQTIIGGKPELVDAFLSGVQRRQIEEREKNKPSSK